VSRSLPLISTAAKWVVLFGVVVEGVVLRVLSGELVFSGVVQIRVTPKTRNPLTIKTL
jgi:hypothetical protein